MRIGYVMLALSLALLAPEAWATGNPFPDTGTDNEAATIIFQILEDILSILIWAFKEVVDIIVEAIRSLLPDFGFGSGAE